MKYIAGILFVVAYGLFIHFVISNRYEKKNFDTIIDIILVAIISFGIIAIEILLMEKTDGIGKFVKEVHNINIIPSTAGFTQIDGLLIAMPCVYSLCQDDGKMLRKVLGVTLSVIAFILYLVIVKEHFGY